jgi:hypothetical protein
VVEIAVSVAKSIGISLGFLTPDVGHDRFLSQLLDIMGPRAD